MSTGYTTALTDEWAMRRGLVGGMQEPMQRLDFNFAESGMGGAFQSPLAPLIVQPLINAFFGHGGIMPAQFAPQQGLYDQWRAKQYWQARQAALATASSADRETYVQMLRGMAQMQGTPWGLEQERSANVMAGDAAFMAPVMAQAMPELFDEMHGSRGSATVMASFLHRGGLTAVDPATGRTGISGPSAGVLAAEMHRRFFGANADLAGWRGMRAGQAGALYTELQNRGVMGPSIGTLTTNEQIAALGGSATSREDALRLIREQNPEMYADLVRKAGLAPPPFVVGGVGGIGPAAATAAAAATTGEDQIRKLSDISGIAESAIQKIQESEPTKFDAMLRQFDANKIGNRLKDMSGAVAAMREIFGDMGKPNAPMADLIEGLNALTQGGLATMNPADLERTVRTTQVIARTSGMGMQALQGLVTQGAAMAQAAGLDRRFGIKAGQAAAEFSTAYGQVGGGDVPGWGSVSRDELTLLDEQLRINAAKSPMANQLGAMMRIVETLEKNKTPITGPLAAVARAVRTHQTEFEVAPGKFESLNMNRARMFDILQQSNVEESVGISFLTAQSANQEPIDRYNIQNIVRRRQPDDLLKVMEQGFQETVLGRLAQAGVTDPTQRGAITEAAATAQAQAMLRMAPEIRKNDKLRNQALMEAAREGVERQFRDQGMSPTEATAEFDRLFPRDKLALMVAGGVGRIQETMMTSEAWRGYGGLNPALDVNNPKVTARREFLEAETAAEVELGRSLAGLATTPFLARAMNEIQDPSTTIAEAVQKALGGEPTELVRERLAAIDLDAVGKRAGMPARERVQVITEAILETTKEYRDTRANKKLSAEERLRLDKRYTARINALQTGNEVDEEIRDELAVAGLVDARADPATVKAMTQAVLSGTGRGAGVKPEVRKRIAQLVGAGGAVDADMVRREQLDLLRSLDFKESDLAAALRGDLDEDKRMTPEARIKLQALARLGGGLYGAAADAGLATGVLVGEKELAGAAAQERLLAMDVAKPLPTDEQEKKEALATRQRHAETMIERDRRLADLLLMNDASLTNLGKGGFKVAKKYRETQQEIARLAAKEGLVLSDILSGADRSGLTDKQRATAEEIDRLHSSVAASRAELLGMSTKVEGREVTTAAERAETIDYRAKATQTDDAQNRTLIGSILQSMGPKAAADEATKAALAQELGKGPEAEEDRFALTKKFEARKALLAMSKNKKLDLVSLKEAAEAGIGTMESSARLLGLGKLTSDQATEAPKLFEEAGRLGEDDSPDSIRGTLKDIRSHRADVAAAEAKAREAAVPTELTMKGKVAVEWNMMDMAGASASPSGMNTSPVTGKS